MCVYTDIQYAAKFDRSDGCIYPLERMGDVLPEVLYNCDILSVTSVPRTVKRMTPWYVLAQ